MTTARQRPRGLSGVTAIAAGYYHTVALTTVPPPSASSVSPASGPPKGETAVTVTGTNFQPGAKVIFGGLAGTVTSLTPTSISVRAPALQAATVDVKVRNPDGQVATLAAAFSYVGVSTYVVGWGDNQYRQSQSGRRILAGVTGIAAGSFHTMALKNDGTVVAWGDNWLRPNHCARRPHRRRSPSPRAASTLWP